MKPENPYMKINTTCDGFKTERLAWQEGFDAAIKWLNEPCKEHPMTMRELGLCCCDRCFVAFQKKPCHFREHRHLCPKCREEIGLK
jgi:hypothetical protein